MVFRPQPSEQNREPTWELVEMLQNAMGSSGSGIITHTSLVPSSYDNIKLNYIGADLDTIVFKLGAVIVSTLQLTYFAGKLDTVTKI